MTPERAKFLLSLYVSCQGLAFSYSPAPFRNSVHHQSGITLDEDTYIRQVWMFMTDSSSYYDALKVAAAM